MNIRTSVLLVITLALVSGYVFFVQLDEATEPTDEPPWFYNVHLEDMKQITITHLDQRSVFALGTDGRWHMDGPDGLPAAGDRWGGIELLLSGPKTRRLLNPQPTDLEPYGLDSPKYRIEVDLKDGSTIPLLLGLESPDGGIHYAQIEGFPQVFTIYSGWGEVLASLISDPPYPQWYYNIDTATLTNIELESEGKTMALTKSNESWHFNDETKTPLGDVQLSSIMAALNQPLFQKVVDYTVYDLSPYGLDKPSLALFLTTTRLEDNVYFTKDTLIEIGNTTEEGRSYYARTERNDRDSDVYEVDTQWVETLMAVVANWP